MCPRRYRLWRSKLFDRDSVKGTDGFCLVHLKLMYSNMK